MKDKEWVNLAGKGLIGVQMMMLKDKVAQDGAYATFKKLAELGYHCVEVSQIPMTAENVEGMQKASKEFGIKVAACSAALSPAPGRGGESLETDFDKIVSDCKALDCDMLRIGMLPMDCMGSRDKALDFVRRADEMAARLSEQGIDLYYHNHHVEFIKYDGEYLMDIIRNNTKKLGFELDVHWIQRGGENPVTYIEKFAGRIRLLHLKDYRIAFNPPAPAPGADPKEIMMAFFKAFRVDSVQFAEVGEGNLPMKEIIDTGLRCGSEYFLIEQDDQYGRDPYDCLITSRDNLIKLGYGDWFNL